MDLYDNGAIDETGKGTVEGDVVKTCESKWYTADGLKDEKDLTSLSYDDVGYLPGRLYLMSIS